MRIRKAVLATLPSLGMVGAVAVERRQADNSQDVWNGMKMCFWLRPMSAMVRDHIYLDGGYLLYKEVQNGITLSTVDTSAKNLLFKIDLRQPWEMTDVLNVSTIIQSTLKGGPDANPNLENGHMLANNYSFYELGGSIKRSDAMQDYPKLNWSLAYDIYPRTGTVLRNPESFRKVLTGDDVNRAIVQGAYTSAPSEEKGWIFGGSRNGKGVDVRTRELLSEYTGDKISNYLITADLSTNIGEKWENSTLPDDIKGRALAEVAWLPVSNNGVLVVIGGTSMTYNQSESYGLHSESQVDKWKEEGKSYMEEVSIYDVSAKEWYKQKTFGDIPPPTADFCSVVTTSQDRKSHHIYIYGGFNGLTVNGRTMDSPDGGIVSTDSQGEFTDGTYDTAYVLSIPAFHWTKVYKGKEAGRRGHRCHRVADNTMLVIGGYPFPEQNCLPGNLIRPFNLNDPKFETKYHPENNAPYEIPVKVTEDIGGDAKGGEKIVDWDDDDLENVFNNPYTKKVKHDWPFVARPSDGDNESGGNDDKDDSGDNGSGLPTYVPPLLGTILGLLVLGAILGAILYFLRRRRRKIRRLQSDSAASTVVKRRQTWSWLMNTREGPEKVGFEDYAATEHGPDYDGSTVYGSPNVERPNPLNTYEAPNTQISEAPGTQIYEMPANEVSQELPTRPAPATRQSQTVTFNEEVEQLGPRASPSETSDPISPLSHRPSLKKTTSN